MRLIDISSKYSSLEILQSLAVAIASLTAYIFEERCCQQLNEIIIRAN